MEIVQLESIQLKGISVRTRNSNEMDPLTAKIGSLWERFYNENAKHLNSNSSVYGVYYSYESDATGEFNVLAGSTFENVGSELSKVSTEKGKYMVFSKEGEMPGAVIEAWQEIWSFFSKSECSYNREYLTDFEKYIGTNKVEVYIGIK
ncbi:GyrI-like domain-containing protein [Halobacteriovorax sp. JY17]|uniref:GyrI-like domain-containing protein n=1 Tax=Halobacteriovorax sp. JY17 TaxID=2014617 RepID=UPI000C43EFB3|nr:GyrI-like domain-containing protein [Halobacteriovorax sp. JY17]PIK16391.1 MAG: hypothetical protein CES88_06525 [Halobacteriovorax sp. JY17]